MPGLITSSPTPSKTECNGKQASKQAGKQLKLNKFSELLMLTVDHVRKYLTKIQHHYRNFNAFKHIFRYFIARLSF